MGEVGVPPALEAAVESLRDAVTAGRTDIVRRLLDACDSCDGGGTEERMQLINSQCAEDGGTFLHLATRLGHGDIVRALLSSGGDPGVVNSHGDTCLQVAATPAVQAVYTEDLLKATAQSDLGRVCQLLAGGLSVNSYDNPVSRNTPLHWAASFADTNTLHCLIARGACVSSVNSDGCTPLHDAVARGDPAVVEALLQRGAGMVGSRCTAGRHKGKTPMEMAEDKGGDVLAVMQRYAGHEGAFKIKGGAKAAGVTGEALDMRGLAGSLESLNSIGGDSAVLSSNSVSLLPITHTPMGVRAGSAQVHQTRTRTSVNLGTLSRCSTYKEVSVEQSIIEDANGEDSSSCAMVDGSALINGGDEGKDSAAERSVPRRPNTSRLAQEQQHRSQSVSLSRSPISSTSSLDLSPNMEQVHDRLVSSCSSSAPPTPLITSLRLLQLWPQPRTTSQLAGPAWQVPHQLTIAAVPGGGVSVYSMYNVIEVHRGSLEECGVKVVTVGSLPPLHISSACASVVCSLPPALACTPQHYRLTVTARGVRISCGSLDSLHNALVTLVQLLRLHSNNTDDAQQKEASPPPHHHFQRLSSVNGSSNNLLSQASESHQLHGSTGPRHHHSFLLRSQSEVGSSPALSAAVARHSINGDANANTNNIINSSGGRISSDNSANSSDSAIMEVESVCITDGPDVPHRGFMLDAAPLARLPNLETMYHIVDTLQGLKLNQLHLMMRLQQGVANAHRGCVTETIAHSNNNDYSSHSELTNVYTEDNAASNIDSNNAHNNIINYATPSVPVKNVSTFRCHVPLPYSPDELLLLSRYCRDRGLSLVPAFDLEPSWMTLRHSVAAVTAAVADALTHFPGVSYVSIGPALTSVLSSAAASDVMATGAGCGSNPWQCLGVSDVATLVVCANVFQTAESRHLRQFVPHSALLMDYGFQADYDFSKSRDAAMSDGLPYGVCSGTAAWSSLAGFPEAGVSNVFRSCVGGGGEGATCVVFAHWSTPASLTPLVFMWPPLLVGAGLAWNCRTHWDYVHSSIGSLIDTHLIRINDCGFGSALVELGRCETWLTREMRGQDSNDLANLPPSSSGPGSVLHQLLADPDSVVLDNLTTDKFGAALRHVKRAIRLVHNNRVVRSPWPLLPVAAAELNLSADLLLTASRLGRALVTVGSNPHSNLGMAVVNPGLAHLPPTLRTDVANRLLSLREAYSCLWLHCHQPSGLQASLLLLSSLLARLLPHHTRINEL